MQIKKYIIFIIMFCVFFYSASIVKADEQYPCRANLAQLINKIYNGGSLYDLTSTEKNNLNQLTSCKCIDGIKEVNSAYCKKAQDRIATGYNSEEIKDIGVVSSTFTMNNNTTKNDAAYNYSLAQLLALVKSILNVFIGITLFILGFSFLYNVSQLGLHSSSPQKRELTLNNLGGIFATAIYVGCIPVILQFVTSLISALSKTA